MSRDLQLLGRAKRTHDGYLREVRKLACYFKLSPDQLSQRQVADYLLYLINDKNFAPGSLKVAYSALKFFYTTTCPRDWNILDKLKVPKQTTLPDVLTIKQVHQLIASTKQLHNAAFLWTIYTLGLRLEEGLNLQIGDIDSQRMTVHVHRGKGAKDRMLPLPQSTLQVLRNYWKQHRNARLLFPANGRNRKSAAIATTSMNGSSVQGCVKRVALTIGINKSVSPHTLRHSIATHLFESGVSLPWIQKFLGHSNLATTLRYLHLTDDANQDGRNQLNDIADKSSADILFKRFFR
jgi:integrase/recombinase XerD